MTTFSFFTSEGVEAVKTHYNDLKGRLFRFDKESDSRTLFMQIMEERSRYSEQGYDVSFCDERGHCLTISDFMALNSIPFNPKNFDRVFMLIA